LMKIKKIKFIGLNKMNKTKLLNLVIIFLVFISFINSVESLGVSPGRTTINFEPGLKQSIPFIVYNSENKEMTVEIEVQGDLKDVITLNDQRLSFSVGEDAKSSSYDFNLPKDLGPGIHEAKIVIKEVSKSSSYADAFIGASAAVVTQLHVIVPYPGKYVIAELKVSETGEGQPLMFLVPVTNYGTQDIIKARGTIEIYGSNNEKVASLETNEQAIKSKERVELVGRLDTQNIKPGEYTAKVSVNYDNNIANAEIMFEYGSMKIEILSVNIDNIVLGQIAKVNILVKNLWTDIVKNVFVEIIVFDKEENELTRTKSASEDIPGNTEKELIGYWDTKDLKVGTYKGKMLIHYEDKTTEKPIEAVVNQNSIKVNFIGVTGQAVAMSGDGQMNKDILVLLLFILIGINVAWFVYFKKKK